MKETAGEGGRLLPRNGAGISDGSPGHSVTSEREPTPIPKRPLVLACLATSLLLTGFLVLQGVGSPLVHLPAQWLGIAILPILIALIVGGYFKNFKFNAFGVSFEGTIKDLPNVGPSTDDAPAEEAGISTNAEYEWTRARRKEYERTRDLALVHTYKPSAARDGWYDVSIFLMRHRSGRASNQTTNFADVQRAEFFFGPSWGNQIFAAENQGGLIGVNASAWGTFLAICRVTFREGHEPVVLYRYVDFEMAH